MDRMSHLKAQLAHRRLILSEKKSDVIEIANDIDSAILRLEKKQKQSFESSGVLENRETLMEQIVGKRDEIERLKHVLFIKDVQLKEKIDKLVYLREKNASTQTTMLLQKAQKNIIPMLTKISQVRSICDNLQQEALELRQLLISRRQRLLYELSYAFEINTTNNSKRMIRNLPLTPVSSLLSSLQSDGSLNVPSSDPEDEDAALGFVTILIQQLAKVLDVPVVVSPCYAGSRSFMWDIRGVSQSSIKECLELIAEMRTGVLLGGANVRGGVSDQILLDADVAALIQSIAATGCVRLPLYRSPTNDLKTNLVTQQLAAASSLSATSAANQILMQNNSAAGNGFASSLLSSSVHQNLMFSPNLRHPILFGSGLPLISDSSLYVASQITLFELVGQIHKRQGFDARGCVGILESIEALFAKEIWIPEAQISASHI
eukprot:GDKJ01026132.1.p1 GENE.GDKJ01026132.1~~GDKJ01026132.1.p1  ORF type:complete len:433 (+),score=105.39 GDKJ01026132.1:51-1349(+)